MSNRRVILLAILAALTLISLFMLRQQSFPVAPTLALGAVAWGLALVVMGIKSAGLPEGFARQWTWQGAVTWLGAILLAAGIFWGIRSLLGTPPSGETMAQLITGFVLAYVVGLVIYHLYRVMARSRANSQNTSRRR